MSIKETEAELRRLTEALRASQLLEAASTQEVLDQKARAEKAEAALAAEHEVRCLTEDQRDAALDAMDAARADLKRLRDGITALIQRGEADYGINSSPVERLRALLDDVPRLTEDQRDAAFKALDDARNPEQFRALLGFRDDGVTCLGDGEANCWCAPPEDGDQ